MATQARNFSLVLILAVSMILFGGAVTDVLAQQNVGIVTALQGQAQLTRAGARSGLRFKDPLALRDLVDTAERSSARILFGGKSTVTLRELSRLEVREETIPAGLRLNHNLGSGGVLVHVARQLLGPNDEVQIQTPNAVAGVRGTTVYASYNPAIAQTDFTVIVGSVIVTPNGLGPITLNAGSSISIFTGPTGGVQASAVRNVSPQEADAILAAAEIGPAVKQEAGRSDSLKNFSDKAAKEELPQGAANCWPYLICQPQSSLGATLGNLPLPAGSSIDTGVKGFPGISATASPRK